MVTVPVTSRGRPERRHETESQHRQLNARQLNPKEPESKPRHDQV